MKEWLLWKKSVTGNLVFDLVAYVLLVALGQAILFRGQCFLCGVDIIAKLINKVTDMEIGKAVMVAGMATAMTSIFAYGSAPSSSVLLEHMRMDWR